MVDLSTAWGSSSWIDVSDLIWVITTTSGVSPYATLYQVYTD